MSDWTEAEKLIVEYTNQFGKDIDRCFEDRIQKSIVEHGRKLIAEREPKIMSAEDMLRIECEVCLAEGYRTAKSTENAIVRLSGLRERFLANIAAVLDKKLADADCTEQARRIVAEVLKAQS